MNIKLCSPAKGETISLLPPTHKALLDGRLITGTVPSLDWTALKQAGSEHSFPLPVEFIWTVTDVQNPTAHSMQLWLSTEPDFSHSRIIPLPVDAQKAEVFNFKAGTQYFWKIVRNAENGCCSSNTGSFFTRDETPTLYRADGLTNIRDTGGWRTANGDRIRRGMVFRGSEMDTHHTITDQGRQSLRDELGIHTDLDLRGEAVGKIHCSPLGGDIRFELLPVKAYAEFMAEDQAAACRAVFALFADANAYPVYLHCWGGADRTGTVVLLLNALLGAGDEDLLLDYEMTSFSIWGERSRNSEQFQSLLTALAQYGSPADPLRIKAENYLLTAGVTKTQVATIRALLLESETTEEIYHDRQTEMV